MRYLTTHSAVRASFVPSFATHLNRAVIVQSAHFAISSHQSSYSIMASRCLRFAAHGIAIKTRQLQLFFKVVNRHEDRSKT